MLKHELRVAIIDVEMPITYDEYERLNAVLKGDKYSLIRECTPSGNFTNRGTRENVDERADYLRFEIYTSVMPLKEALDLIEGVYNKIKK